MISLDHITHKGMYRLLEVSPFGGAFGILFALFEKYVFADWEFLGFLFVLSVLDTVMGMYFAWKEHKFSSEGYKRVFGKMIVYSCLVILCHVLAHINISGMGRIVFDVVRYGIYCSLIINETVSILTNAGKLGYAIPAWILKRLSDFNEKGEYINKKADDTTNNAS
jgi:toxin secretion/phage lysis holin